MSNTAVAASLAGEWHREIDTWLGWMRASSKRPKTIELREYQIRRFAETMIEVSPWLITLDMLAAWLGAHDWSIETRRTYRATLRTFYTWAHVTGRISTNPAWFLPSITPPRGMPKPVPEVMYRAAVRAAGERERLMLRLAAEAGLRRGEITLVRRGDVERGSDGFYLRVDGKGGHVRRVPIGESMAGTISRSETDWIFPGETDGHLTPAHVGKLISRLLDDGWSAHKCRHRFATLAFEVERDIRAVQELLGHASVRTTQIYTLVPDSAMRRAASAASAA